MSDNGNNNAAPDPADVLMGQVYVPAFIRKCAERGVVFNSQEELQDALEVGAMLNIKMATAGNELSSVTGRAKRALREHLKEAGIDLPGEAVSPVAVSADVVQALKQLEQAGSAA